MILKLWDGSKKTTEDMVLKGVYEVPQLYNRDIITPKSTKFTIIHKDLLPEYGDIVTTTINNVHIFGMITNATNNKPAWDIEVFWNSDALNVYLNNYNGLVSGFNITENNESQYTQKLITTDKVTIDTNIAKLNKLCQTTMVMSPKEEIATQYEDRFEVVLQQAPNEVLTIKLTNPVLSNVQVALSDDTFNALILRNQDDLTKYEKYYLAEDRTISQDASKAQHPIIWNREDVTVDEYTDIEVAKSKINAQSYSNSVTITVPLNNSIIPLQFDNRILSKRVNVLTENDYLFETIITGIDIEHGMMKVTMGVTRNNILGSFIKLKKGL